MSIKIVLLCEDLQTACFARYFLIEKLKYDNREIRVEMSPPGKDSGEQWVRSRFISELLAYRSQHSAIKPLVVFTDADTMSVKERINTLKVECEKSNIPFPSLEEKIALIIPKRNIETWIRYLRGEDVDEEKVYTKDPRESKCKADIHKLVDICNKQELPKNILSSLKIACSAYQKIL